MNFLESLKGAIQNLKGNKVRSFLTMLGIIIGISSVITMSAIGKGGQQNITGDLKEGGYGKFTISIDKDDEEFRWKYLLEPEIVDSLKETNIFKNVSANVSTRVFLELAKRREIIQLIALHLTTKKLIKLNIFLEENFYLLNMKKEKKF